MANYKDIIAGTLSGLGSKVKVAAETANVRGIYEQGASRARNMARLAKLSLEINGDGEELKKVYAEIGKLFYEQTREAPDGIYAALFSRAEEIGGRLRDKKAEIEAMKAQYGADGDIEVEISQFEDIVSATEDEGKGT